MPRLNKLPRVRATRALTLSRRLPQVLVLVAALLLAAGPLSGLTGGLMRPGFPEHPGREATIQAATPGGASVAPDLIRGNPAWHAASVAARSGHEATLPLGLGQAAFPPRNPADALNDPESFNMLALGDSVLYPTRYNPGEPDLFDRIDISLTEDGLSIEGFIEGQDQPQPVSLRAYGGARSPRLASEGVIPDSFIRGRFGRSPFSLEYGVYSGGVGIESVPNDALEEDLAAGALSADRDYGLELNLAGQAGVTLAPVISNSRSFRRGTLTTAVRLLSFYDIAWAQASAAYDLRVGDDAAVQDISGAASYGYPGNGFGLGARVDLGIVYERSRWAVGLGATNAGSVTRRAGTALKYGNSLEEMEVDVFTTAFAPRAEAAAIWRPAVGTGDLTIISQVAAAEYLYPRVRTIYELGPVFLAGEFSWDDAPAVRASYGITLGRSQVELAATNHPYPFSEQRASGFEVTVRRLRRRSE